MGYPDKGTERCSEHGALRETRVERFMPRQNWSQYRLEDAVIEWIYSNPLDGETPASRLKQVGLMMFLHRMKRRDIKTTIPTMVAGTGVSRAAATIILEPLLKRGILIENRVLNVTGKGHATNLEFAATLDGLIE